MKHFLLSLFLLLSTSLIAQDEAILLKNVTIIDGKGNPPLSDQQLLIEGGRITKIGARVKAPKKAKVINCKGKTVLPGLIDMHAHMYGNTGGRIESMFEAYPPLYLAGGVTTAFSPGEFDPTGAIILKENIEKGIVTGPHFLTAGRYFDKSPSQIGWIGGETDTENSLSKFKRWKNKIDAVKVYTSIDEEQFKAIVKEAQKEGLFVTGHLSSLSAAKAIELGINGIEHGIFSMSEFWPEGASYDEMNCKLAELNIDGKPATDLMDAIIKNNVYIDPTIVIFETSLSDFKPVTEDWGNYIDRDAKFRLEVREARRKYDNEVCDRKAIQKQRAFIKALYDKGGMIVTGTDPVSVKLIPGYGLHREIQILTETGISNLEAIKAATYNGAVALRLSDQIGSVEVGKRADLVIVNGNPAENIEAIGDTEIVIKAGIIYFPKVLRESAKGLIGKR